MNIDIHPYTIIMTIGSSNCGKTYFCKNVLIPQLNKLPILNNYLSVNINYISSDDIRRQLLNSNYDKNDQIMLTASKAAFDLLYQQVESACTFPANSEFIIVDTKGTSEVFRKKIYEIANKYHYKVLPLVFFYSDYDDYKKFTSMGYHATADLKKIKEYLFGREKKNKVIDKIIRIKSVDFSDISVSSSQHELLTKCYVSDEQKYFIVSDIHGCYDEFYKLLTTNGFVIQDNKIISSKYQLIILGDFIDKGPKVSEVINFIYDNLDKTYIVWANHEHRLHQELEGQLTHINTPWYDTFNHLNKNEQLKDKFLVIMDKAVPFIRNNYFIATHAPCKNKYLGKLDTQSLNKQRYCYYESIPYYTFLKNIGIFDQELCNVYHIFGHMMTSTPGTCISKRILIDGGCVIGNKLGAIKIEGNRYSFVSVQSLQPKIEEELQQIQEYKRDYEPINIDLTNIDYQLEQRINRLIDNKVNFISGTMSPVDKFNNELESIDAGIEFYKSAGVYDVTVQQKYMGSRANCYLFSSNEQSYMISRNGFKIKLSLDHIYDILRLRLQDKFNIDWNKVHCVILDGELMPWSALGEGLIKDFRTVGANIGQEIKFLEDTNFEQQLKILKQNYDNTSFDVDSKKLKKTELIDKYGLNQYETFSTFQQLKSYIPTLEQKSLLNIYNRQVQLYGYDIDNTSQISYKPFALLKIVYNDSNEIIPYIHKFSINDVEVTNELMFNLLNEDSCYSFNLNDDNDVIKLKELFTKYTTELHYEGVVLKPTNMLETKVPPYLKVRNPEYLSIIYGYDYHTPNKYSALLQHKSIRYKLKASKEQWYLGLKLLSIPYNLINEDNINLKKLYVQFLNGMDSEKTLDPRL